MSHRYWDEPTYTPYWYIEDGEVKRVAGGVQRVALCDGTDRLSYIVLGEHYTQEYVADNWFTTEEAAQAVVDNKSR